MREFDLLRRVYAKNALLPARVEIPPGDDMAALRVDASTLLIAVDQVIEGRHVLVGTEPVLIGRKAITRNLSDVAAMAAKPVATVVACALPGHYDANCAEALFEGLRTTAAHYDCPLIGGDISIVSIHQRALVCSVTILAEPAWPGARVVTRRGARTGDRVYVTGQIGGSYEPDGSGRHLSFEPRVSVGQELLRQLGARLRAMIDVSDGLGRDAAHLVETDAGNPSDRAIVLDAASIPCASGRSWQQAIGDGEDYELLFVADGAVPEAIEGVPIHCIGEVRAQSTGSVLVRDGDQLVDVSAAGWEHRAHSSLQEGAR